jgi:hypothetical protein
VAEFTYYCKVTCGSIDVKPGIYSVRSKFGALAGILNLLLQSDKVWRQGPKGGVKIYKDRSSHVFGLTYITKNEEEMKKFMWIKLQATSLN